MDCKRKGETTKFVPFTLEIKVESEAEARALWHIFNHVRNINLLPTGMWKVIQSVIGNEYCGDTDGGVEIANGITRQGFYGKGL